MTLNAFKTLDRWLLSSFMIFASVILLTTGIPRFLHELMLVPGTPIQERLSAGKTVTDEELAILEKSRLDALKFIELPDAYSDLGSAYLTRARLSSDKEKRLKYAQMSISALMKGLEMSPLNTFAWLRLSTAYVLLGPTRYDEALEAWRKSVAVARFEPFILMQRIHIGTILYGNMTPGDVEILKDQLGSAYQWNKRTLKRYSQQNSLTEWIIFLAYPDEKISKYITNGLK